MKSYLPNFLIIGAQKAGTTTLYEVLRKNPAIFMPSKKEINYFTFNYHKGISFYHHAFSPNNNQTIIGEASPGYMCYPEAAKRIYRLIPHAKLIVIVRNPVDRAYSQYWDHRRKLCEYRSFDESLAGNLHPDYVPGTCGYFSRGVYIKYIRQFLQYFPLKQLLVVLFDDLAETPDTVFNKIIDFLGVSPCQHIQNMPARFNHSAIYSNALYRYFFYHHAKTKYLPQLAKWFISKGTKIAFPYPAMHPHTHKKLLEFYAPWNLELARFLNRDLSCWNQ